MIWKSSCSRSRPTSWSRGQVITGRRFFPDLIAVPFHDGLVVVFAVTFGSPPVTWPTMPGNESDGNGVIALLYSIPGRSREASTDLG
jgi:hypothetical protein